MKRKSTRVDSRSEQKRLTQTRIYYRDESVVFMKTTDEFGGLSNMAAGFPLSINGIYIPTVEALYQACRFPHLPEIQRLIIGQRSPMTAKMKSKPYRSQTRSDWDHVRVNVMRWCLRVKLAQHWRGFGDLLLETGNRPIVEQSFKDEFWGAKPADDSRLVGMNVLGRLLMELREELKNQAGAVAENVDPLLIPNFLLCSNPIQPVLIQRDSLDETKPENENGRSDVKIGVAQIGLFDQQSARNSKIAKDTILENLGKVAFALPQYPLYKSTNVLWLGQVPEHWSVKPNRSLFTEVKDQNRPNEQMLSVTISKGVIQQSALLSESAKKDSSNLDKSKYKLVLAGDLAYNKMRAWQGAIGVSRFRGIVSPAYVVQRPKEEVLSEYVHYLFRLPSFATEAERWSYGITSDMWSLRPEHFKLIQACVPSIEEQVAIVRFLNHVDRKIRRYIQAKQKLIKLLEEQKQAIIHQAVTRGLDPHVRLKPSGVEWLGEIPEHWAFLRVKTLFRLRTEFSGLGHGKELLSIYTHIGVRPRKELEEKGNRATTTDNYWVVKKGDIIVNKLLAWMGAIGVSEYDGVTSPAYDILMPKQKLTPEYYHHLFRTHLYHEQFKQNSRGIMDMRLRLYFDQFGQIPVPIPPFREQETIVDYCREATASLDKTIVNSRKEILLLRELLIRLVSDAATGKLDVREAAAKLPELEADFITTEDQEIPEEDMPEEQSEDQDGAED